MSNEAITEGIVRDQLRELGYYVDAGGLVVEEKTSQIEAIKRLLSTASKTAKGRTGYPEFIISSPRFPDFLLVVECKADLSQHESRERNRPKEYAVDGVLHYAKALASEYNVVAIAASGQTLSSLRISTYLYPKKASAYTVLTNESGVSVESLIPFEDFLRLSAYSPDVEAQRRRDLFAFSRHLHDFMRDHAKLTESEKPLLVSGTLIALQNRPFVSSYAEYAPSELQSAWLNAIKTEIEKADIPNAKKGIMSQPYSAIAVHSELGKATRL